MEEENSHLREILSWVSAREPQLGMMVQQFKRPDGVGLVLLLLLLTLSNPMARLVRCLSRV